MVYFIIFFEVGEVLCVCDKVDGFIGIVSEDDFMIVGCVDEVCYFFFC